MEINEITLKEFIQKMDERGIDSDDLMYVIIVAQLSRQKSKIFIMN